MILIRVIEMKPVLLTIKRLKTMLTVCIKQVIDDVTVSNDC